MAESRFKAYILRMDNPVPRRCSTTFCVGHGDARAANYLSVEIDCQISQGGDPRRDV